MAWIILEGLDRTGKSSVANLYKGRGFHHIHFKAPDKKYLEYGYVGPSYFEDIMEIYVSLSGRDVVFDRSIYGELVWPKIYNRDPVLNEEEFEQLIEVEQQNSTQHILMYDPNVKKHYERCVKNNEPLNKNQFMDARKFFDEVAVQYGFGRKKLTDFGIEPGTDFGEDDVSDNSGLQDADAETSRGEVDIRVSKSNKSTNKAVRAKQTLEKANAINTVLTARIIKKKGEIYDVLEQDIRNHLEEKLSTILGNQPKNKLDDDEVQILKLYVKRIKQMDKEKR